MLTIFADAELDEADARDRATGARREDADEDEDEPEGEWLLEGCT